MRVGGRAQPSAFWDAYANEIVVPTDYERTRPLFQLYYLLAWLPGFYHAAQRTPTQRQSVIDQHERLIIELLGH